MSSKGNVRFQEVAMTVLGYAETDRKMKIEWPLWCLEADL